MGTTREVRAYVLAVVRICSAVVGLGMGCGGAHADTLEWALVQAYQNNPSLNAQRASLRAWLCSLFGYSKIRKRGRERGSLQR
jgi:hypothetical protein